MFLSNRGSCKNISSVSDPSSFDHIYRKKSKWELFRLSLIVMGIEFTYSALTAYVSPILLELGIGYSMTMHVWGISPIFGFFLSPVMGTLSDRCSYEWGRRRPFIVIFAILNTIGLVMILFGDHAASLDLSNPNHTLCVLITIIGVVVADYCSDALQSPSRAYMIDVCTKEDHTRGLASFTIMAGAGGVIGYILGSFDWTYTFIGELLGGNVQTVFTIASIAFVICITLSITTFKEIPLNLLGQMKQIQEVESPPESHDVKMINEFNAVKSCNATHYGSIKVEYTPPQSPIGLKDYMKSILITPYSIKILCLTNILCWMCHHSYTLYFTDFVGEQIYHGNPLGAVGSPEQILYQEGVRFACLGLAAYSLSCTCYSFYIEKLIATFGLKNVYIGGLIFDGICLLLMGIFKNRWMSVILSCGCGVMYCTLFTVPYILIAHYHSVNIFDEDSRGHGIIRNQVRGLGTDISLISSCVFVAQFFLSLFLGHLVDAMNNITTVIYVASLFAILASIVSCKIVYLDLA